MHIFRTPFTKKTSGWLFLTMGGFHSRFQEMIHPGYQLKVSHKLITHVELFSYDDILTKMFYVIYSNYLALKLFFYKSEVVGWYL